MTGIYCIFSNIDKDKIYIGSAKNITSRIKRHLSELKNNKHNNKKMQNYFNKHSLDNFNYRVLVLCSEQELIVKEQFYLDFLNPYFNVLKKAYSLEGYKHTEDSKIRISNRNKGRKMTEEQVKKGVLSRKGQKTSKGCKRTEEMKKHLSKIKKKKVIYNNVIYDSLIEVSEATKIPYSSLYAMITNKYNNKLNLKYYA